MHTYGILCVMHSKYSSTSAMCDFPVSDNIKHCNEAIYLDHMLLPSDLYFQSWGPT